MNGYIGAIGINNHMWKGDSVSYKVLHKWVRRWLPKPKFCEKCNLVPPKEISNNNKEYKRDITNWEWLCKSCHVKKDIKFDTYTKRRSYKEEGSPNWKGGITKNIKLYQKLYMHNWTIKNREKVRQNNKNYYYKKTGQFSKVIHRINFKTAIKVLT